MRPLQCPAGQQAPHPRRVAGEKPVTAAPPRCGIRRGPSSPVHAEPSRAGRQACTHTFTSFTHLHTHTHIIHISTHTHTFTYLHTLVPSSAARIITVCYWRVRRRFFFSFLFFSFLPFQSLCVLVSRVQKGASCRCFQKTARSRLGRRPVRQQGTGVREGAHAYIHTYIHTHTSTYLHTYIPPSIHTHSGPRPRRMVGRRGCSDPTMPGLARASQRTHFAHRTSHGARRAAGGGVPGAPVLPGPGGRARPVRHVQLRASPLRTAALRASSPGSGCRANPARFLFPFRSAAPFPGSVARARSIRPTTPGNPSGSTLRAQRFSPRRRCPKRRRPFSLLPTHF